jgi:Flp pilus assembly pilin Flp
VDVLLRIRARAQVLAATLRRRAAGDRGATAVEYAIMLAFIAAVIVAAVAFLGSATNSGFSTVDFP